MRNSFLDGRGKILVDLINDVVDPETVPPFYQKFSIQQVIVNRILPHTNPVDPVLDCHVKDGWKLGTMGRGIVP